MRVGWGGRICQLGKSVLMFCATFALKTGPNERQRSLTRTQAPLDRGSGHGKERGGVLRENLLVR